MKVCICENGELRSLSGASKYCSQKYHRCGKLDDVLSKVQEPLVIIPTTDIGMIESFQSQAIIKQNHIFPFGADTAYKQLSDKSYLFRIAQELDISHPYTIFCQGKDIDPNFSSIAAHIPLPAVLKPALSRIHTSHGWLKTSVRYAQTADDFMRIAATTPFDSHSFLIQERIHGPGVGIFLLCNQGQTEAFFAHRRIREKPPSGGVSVVCESIDPPHEALDAAKRLFQRVGWTGVGMVEFKVDKRDNRPKLMEVNARFWGSLQLAISAGVDFPYLLYKMALGKDCSGPASYRTGLRSRWELGDLDHLLIRLKNRSSLLSLPEDAPAKSKVFFNFCTDFFRSSIQNEVFKWSDPKPFFFELKQYVRDLRK